LPGWLAAKEHPSFSLSVRPHVEALPNVYFANHAITSDLIKRAELIITVNSTVGLEALVLGKKVLVLGDAHYDIDGVTLRAHSSDTMHDAFTFAQAWEPCETRRDAFIRFVFNRFLIQGSRGAPSAMTAQGLEERAAGTDRYTQILQKSGYLSG
jgi:capsular polysaccharide export protein